MRLSIVITFLFFALPTWAGELRRLESVELRHDETGSWLELKTDRPANFTSFKLHAPTRIVVDFPETIAPETEHDTAQDGLIRRWAFETLGEGASAVVRLSIELRDDADYTLTANGRRLSLRLLPATGRPLVALDGQHRVAEPDWAFFDEVEGVPATGIVESPALAADVVPDPVALIGAVVQPEPAAEAQLEPTGKPTGATEPVAAGKPSPDVMWAPEPQTPRRLETTGERPDPWLPQASLEQIAFRRTGDGARIVLRTSRPVRWVLVEESDEVVFLELENTQIQVARNRLPLDTRFFNTPVARVVPSEEAALGTTKIAVELSHPARWTAFANGDQVIVEVSSQRTLSTSVGDETW